MSWHDNVTSFFCDLELKISDKQHPSTTHIFCTTLQSYCQSPPILNNLFVIYSCCINSISIFHALGIFKCISPWITNYSYVRSSNYCVGGPSKQTMDHNSACWFPNKKSMFMYGVRYHGNKQTVFPHCGKYYDGLNFLSSYFITQHIKRIFFFCKINFRKQMKIIKCP